MRRRPAAAACLVALALALSGCGGGHGNRGHRGHHRGGPQATPVIDVYASFPLRGSAQARSLVAGVRLALRQAGRQAGAFRVRLLVRASDRPVASGQPGAAAADARAAATDEHAVLFLGGFTDASAELSVPILNLAPIPEISVGSTYIGLTRRVAGVTAPNEPQVYYPANGPTLVRLVPDQAAEAQADLVALAQKHCDRLALAHDGSAYGEAMAALIELEKGGSGVTVVSDTLIGAGTAALRTYAAALRGQQQGAQCFEYASSSPQAAVSVLRAVHAALPAAPLLVPGRLCGRRLANPRQGGVPGPVAAMLDCTRPTLPVGRYPGGFAFSAAYRAAYGTGAVPDAWALFGFEAMRLGLDTIARLGREGDSRAALVRALRAAPLRHTPIGAYRFDPNGDTTLRLLGLYRIDPARGHPVFDRVLTLPSRAP